MLIAQAIQGSTVCTVTSDGGIKPILKAERNTIILRDIPADTPAEDIRAAFAVEG